MLSELNKAKLYNAATMGDINVFYSLEARQEPITEPITDDNTTALHIAAEFGHINIINFLLSKKAEINATNTYGVTALHMAAQASQHEIITLLIEQQADVNVKNGYGETALHMAVENQDEEVLKELLNCPNIKLNLQNHIGNTALHIATKLSSKNILEALLMAGKEKNSILEFINLKNHSCKTALEIASQRGEHNELAKLITEYEQEAIINELATTHHDRSFFIKKDGSHHKSFTTDPDICRDSSFVKKVYFSDKDANSLSRSSSPIKDFNLDGSFIKKESCHDRACFIKKEESFSKSNTSSRSNTPEKNSPPRSFTNKGSETLPDIPHLNINPINKQNSPPFRLRKM